MCGLLFQNRESQDFKDALSVISHRGPDNSSVIKYNGLSMGHVRLGLFDLSEQSNQPMKITENAYFIYNGEIFNFRDFGNFKSDTLMLKKVLNEFLSAHPSIDSFQKKLTQFFNTCNGFFAIAVQFKQHAIFIRDRFGEKPLYFYIDTKNQEFSAQVLIRFKKN